MYDFMILFLMFFFYSVLGYFIEILACFAETKKLTISRGYLVGPYIPLFGFGAIIMVSFLSKYSNDIVILFVLSMVICCLVEYLTGLLLEKVFKLRWWDYSHKKFNINGRVCLENGILFGIGGVIMTKYFNPLLVGFLKSFNENTIIILGSLLFIIVILDAVLSTFIISKLKIKLSKLLGKDATEVIKKQVALSLKNYNIFYERILRAFPHVNLNTNIIKIREYMQEQFQNGKKLLNVKDNNK